MTILSSRLYHFNITPLILGDLASGSADIFITGRGR